MAPKKDYVTIDLDERDLIAFLIKGGLPCPSYIRTDWVVETQGSVPWQRRAQLVAFGLWMRETAGTLQYRAHCLIIEHVTQPLEIRVERLTIGAERPLGIPLEFPVPAGWHPLEALGPLTNAAIEQDRIRRGLCPICCRPAIDGDVRCSICRK